MTGPMHLDRGPKAGALNNVLRPEFAQRFAGILIDIRGADALVVPDRKADEYRPDRQSDFPATRSITAWGSTAQVQRTIVGERVLGLPEDPSNEDHRANPR